jgi:hypothetical protein
MIKGAHLPVGATFFLTRLSHTMIMQLRAGPRYPDSIFRGLVVALLAVSLGLISSVIILRGVMPPSYNGISNATQIVASLTAAGAAAWTYYRRNPDLLLAHGAFAGATWTLANTFWYAYFAIIGEGLNYPTVADLGFAGVFLFLIAGYVEGMERGPLPSWYTAPIALPLVGIGLGLVYLLGANGKTLTTLVVFVLAAVLLSEALLRSAYRYPPIFAATVAFVLAHLFNSLDSTLPSIPWEFGVEAVGPMAAIAFSLFALSYLGYHREAVA